VDKKRALPTAKAKPVPKAERRAPELKAVLASPTPAPAKREKPVFPFSAIAGQEEMKRALMIAAIDPAIGGVLILGDRGTGKSTAIRALARLLPPIKAVENCRYGCDPAAGAALCSECQDKQKSGLKLKAVSHAVPVVDLPLGATEDRVVGALDLERALSHGEKRFEPGLLAKAHRGFLYIDEVNLLEDHLVDLLLDVAASGENVVEREGLSVRHPARFVLIGSGNPEEGDLRPQLLDRFGLALDVKTPSDIATRIEAVKRRDAFERDPGGFVANWQAQDDALTKKIASARRKLLNVLVPDESLEAAAKLCMALGTDGLRGELTLMRAARAYAALIGKALVSKAEIAAVAVLALRHRLRRNPLDETDGGTRITRAITEVLATEAKG
jgi:magnesium chelatase subunit I